MTKALKTGLTVVLMLFSLLVPLSAVTNNTQDLAAGLTGTWLSESSKYRSYFIFEAQGKVTYRQESIETGKMVFSQEGTYQLKGDAVSIAFTRVYTETNGYQDDQDQLEIDQARISGNSLFLTVADETGEFRKVN